MNQHRHTAATGGNIQLAVQVYCRDSISDTSQPANQPTSHFKGRSFDKICDYSFVLSYESFSSPHTLTVTVTLDPFRRNVQQ